MHSAFLYITCLNLNLRMKMSFFLPLNSVLFIKCHLCLHLLCPGPQQQLRLFVLDEHRLIGNGGCSSDLQDWGVHSQQIDQWRKLSYLYCFEWQSISALLLCILLHVYYPSFFMSSLEKWIWHIATRNILSRNEHSGTSGPQKEKPLFCLPCLHCRAPNKHHRSTF